MTSGIGLPTLLTLIFMVLKLVGVITWSWLVVCLPVIIGTGLSVVALIVYLLVFAVFTKGSNKIGSRL